MYVVMFAAAVPDQNKDAYAAHSRAAGEIFKSYGATRIVECWGDAMMPGKLTSFPLAVAAKEGETVVTGWQEWPDKATADACVEQMEDDPRFAALGELPFDGKRLIYGGFETLFDF